MTRMEVQSVRFSKDQWTLIRTAASIAETGTAQFIRDSAYSRAVAVLVVHQLSQEGDNPDELQMLRGRLGSALISHPRLREELLDALGLSWTDTLRRDESPARPSREDHDEASPLGTRRTRR